MAASAVPTVLDGGVVKYSRFMMVFLCVSRPNKSKFRLRQVFRPKFVRFSATTIHFVWAEPGETGFGHFEKEYLREYI